MGETIEDCEGWIICRGSGGDNMKLHLDVRVSRAKDLARADEEEAARVVANKLVMEYADEVRVWRLRAYLDARNRDRSRRRLYSTIGVLID